VLKEAAGVVRQDREEPERRQCRIENERAAEHAVRSTQARVSGRRSR
jgi:hypothetical protein